MATAIVTLTVVSWVCLGIVWHHLITRCWPHISSFQADTYKQATIRFWLRRLAPHRVESVLPSEYHDEGMPLYELTTRWRWLGLETRPRTKVLA